VKQLFARFDLKVFTVIAKEKHWFVKLDEDAMGDFIRTKLHLRQLSDTIHEELKG
jgi:hypothetical protein